MPAVSIRQGGKKKEKGKKRAWTEILTNTNVVIVRRILGSGLICTF